MSKMEWFGVVRGHSRSLEISPFDRARTISYSFYSNCLNLAPILRYSELLVENRRSDLPTSIWHFRWE